MRSLFIQCNLFLKISTVFLLLNAFCGIWAFGQSSGTIRGKITEASNNKPVKFVNVLLQKANGKQKRVQGTTTNAKGRFQLKNLEYGQYELICSYVGYKTRMVEDLELSAKNPVLKLDTLTMKSNAQNLDQVAIEEERDFINQTATGITVNPSKNITQTGGSAIDILRNTPTVNVTFDEPIKMRGTEAGATQVLINGR
jgi:5-hydroxyisourate hydrolase-like protein (transthyretin family)